jgi:lipopolysaccharide transport system ATP-binding protein
MSQGVIRVENLSKSYMINHEGQERYTALRDVITKKVSSLPSLFRPSATKPSKEEFWALKDISFDIEQGDRVGIIGRNGAGKSTLLKVLSRITEPTQGRISIKGRVASLLEVGTGFHPELTGRENIFLNGAILGMSRAEIKRKFDEIIDFAEVERFLDTPVKRYSSGMYVRLAFAVAAHLEPEILIIDEVLAVGDAQFQKKCLGKMEDVSKNEGRTVLLVSHSMTTIQSLANKTVFLNKGRTDGIEEVYSGVQKYLYGSSNESPAFFRPNVVNKHSEAYIVEASLLNSKKELAQSFNTYEPVVLEVVWEKTKDVNVVPNFMLVNQNGATVMIATDAPIDFYGDKKAGAGIYRSRFVIPANLLNANDYFLHLALDNHSPKVCYDHHMDCFRFSVIDPMDENCISRGALKSVREDAILWPALECTFEKISDS